MNIILWQCDNITRPSQKNSLFIFLSIYLAIYLSIYLYLSVTYSLSTVSTHPTFTFTFYFNPHTPQFFPARPLGALSPHNTLASLGVVAAVIPILTLPVTCCKSAAACMHTSPSPCLQIIPVSSLELNTNHRPSLSVNTVILTLLCRWLPSFPTATWIFCCSFICCPFLPPYDWLLICMSVSVSLILLVCLSVWVSIYVVYLFVSLFFSGYISFFL